MSELTNALPDRWQALRQLTDARIALGRAGSSLPTRPQLEFQLSHARARDAVHHELDVEKLSAAIEKLGVEVVCLHSAAADRRTYLQRPDLGRVLGERARQELAQRARAARAQAEQSTAAQAQHAAPAQAQHAAPDLLLVVADGLSALAIESHAARFLSVLLPKLNQLGIKLAPIVVVQQGRVAIGDEIGERFGARMVAILIGERPGLSSPDSMGIYLSWQPKVGLQDSARNCLSNIRPQGMSDAEAVGKFMFLLTEGLRRGLTGVALKDETAVAAISDPAQGRRFML